MCRLANSYNIGVARCRAPRFFMLKEFQEFIAKGNVVDLAVGVVIGSAFSKIVDSLVSDLITPLISPLTGAVDFANYSVMLGQFGPFGIGKFINAVLQFLIVAFALFLIVKGVNRLRRLQGPAPTEDVSVSDLNEQNVEQNKQIIELLQTIAGKPKAP